MMLARQSSRFHCAALKHLWSLPSNSNYALYGFCDPINNNFLVYKLWIWFESF
uniref:Uncharacterized protein n=1 Tax=Parascaris equorum TaxID=6256 RepID=A0A914S7Q0_PAREQ